RRTQPRRFGQAILRRNAAVFEPALRRARHAQAKFSIDVLCTKPGSILFHNESAHVAVVVLRPNNLYVGDGSVANPALAAVQNIMIAVAFYSGFHAARV